MRLIDADALLEYLQIIPIDLGYWEVEKIEEYVKEMPTIESEQTKMIKEIQKWINSGNRGSADYFIVDMIEEIINKYE